MNRKRTVVDPSAVIAMAFDETHGPWVRDYFTENHGRLMMSMVSLFEALIVMQYRQPKNFPAMQKSLLHDLGIQFVETNMVVTLLAVELKRKHPSLNFGDCFVAAHAIHEGCPLITIDSGFKKIDHQIIMPN